MRHVSLGCWSFHGLSIFLCGMFTPKILSGFIPLMSSSVLDSPGRVTTGSLVLMWKEMELLRQGPVSKGRSDGSDGTWDTWKILEN